LRAVQDAAKRGEDRSNGGEEGWQGIDASITMAAGEAEVWQSQAALARAELKSCLLELELERCSLESPSSPTATPTSPASPIGTGGHKEGYKEGSIAYIAQLGRVVDARWQHMQRVARVAALTQERKALLIQAKKKTRGLFETGPGTPHARLTRLRLEVAVAQRQAAVAHGELASEYADFTRAGVQCMADTALKGRNGNYTANKANTGNAGWTRATSSMAEQRTLAQEQAAIDASIALAAGQLQSKASRYREGLIQQGLAASRDRMRNPISLSPNHKAITYSKMSTLTPF